METSINISGTIIAIIIFVLFIKNLTDLVRFIRPQNRRINPNIAWFLLLFFSKAVVFLPYTYGWISYDYYFVLIYTQYAVFVCMSFLQLYLVSKIADSIVAEYKSRDVYFKGKPTFIAGICMSAFYIMITLLAFVRNPYLSGVAACLYIISFIVYWVQTHRAKKTIFNLPIILEEDKASIFHGI